MRASALSSSTGSANDAHSAVRALKRSGVDASSRCLRRQKGPFALREVRHPRESGRFIGRGRDRAKVSDLLAETCVVTLTGSGSCGRTLLAMVVSAGAVGVRSGSLVASAEAARLFERLGRFARVIHFDRRDRSWSPAPWTW